MNVISPVASSLDFPRSSGAAPARPRAVQPVPDAPGNGSATVQSPARLVDGKNLLAAQQDGATDARGLTKDDQEQVQKLRKRDTEVRRHERAHAAAAGPYGGAATFELQKGPDGRLYAVNGEVKIDASPEGDPGATIQKMETVIRAALAPSDPSAQDRAVAQQARRALQEARTELRRERQEPGASANDASSGTRAVGGGPSLNPAAAATDAYKRARDLLAEADPRRAPSLVA